MTPSAQPGAPKIATPMTRASDGGEPSPLPSLLVLTDRRQLPDGRTLKEQLGACIDGGARAVILREKDLPRSERVALARAVGALLAPVHGTLLVASDRVVARQAGAHGVHLAEGDSPPDDGSLLWGRSCHTTGLTGADGCRYATLSPIFPSTSKPGYGPSFGLMGLALARGGIPLYALGGIDTPELAAACIAASAHGVAVMGALMRAPDPAASVAAILAAVDPRSGTGVVRNPRSGTGVVRNRGRVHSDTGSAGTVHSDTDSGRTPSAPVRGAP